MWLHDLLVRSVMTTSGRRLMSSGLLTCQERNLAVSQVGGEVIYSTHRMVYTSRRESRSGSLRGRHWITFEAIDSCPKNIFEAGRLRVTPIMERELE